MPHPLSDINAPPLSDINAPPLSHTVKPPHRGHFGGGPFVPSREVVLGSFVLNLLEIA